MNNIVNLAKARDWQRYNFILRDIMAAPDDNSRQRLQRIAYHRFARLNDLAPVRCRWKPLCDHPEVLHHPIFKHRVFMSRAVIAEPYHSAQVIETAKALATANGLKLWVPPAATASIRSPGKTLFLLFTPPTRDAVTFFPEQVHGIKGGGHVG